MLATIQFRTVFFSSAIKTVKIKIYKTIILPVALYGRTTRSLTLREEHRLRVFENRVLRGISGPNRGEIVGGWRKLHNEDLSNLYSSLDIIRIIKQRRVRWAGNGTWDRRRLHTRF
jgi:hypothetical protein